MESLTSVTGPEIPVLAVTLETVLLRLGLAFVLGVMIAMIYRRMHKPVAYSFGMVLAMVLVTMIVTMIMMVIGNSLARAFGMVGALSLIRFRTPIKDIVDIIYLFIAVGVVNRRDHHHEFL